MVHSPVLDKSFRGFRMMMINGSFVVDPAVMDKVTQMLTAFSNNNKELGMKIWEELRTMGVELGPQIIEQIIKPGI